jgi:hypothetical protein
MTKANILFESTNFFQSQKYVTQNGGELVNEGGKWVVKASDTAAQIAETFSKFNSGYLSEGAANAVLKNLGHQGLITEAMGVHYAIEDHEGEINTHKKHIETLKGLEKHMDHLEDKVGAFGVDVEHNGSLIATHDFPAIGKEDFEEHMRKGKYSIAKRDENSTSYIKNLSSPNDPTDEGLVVNHFHNDSKVNHYLELHHIKKDKPASGGLEILKTVPSPVAEAAPAPIAPVIAEKFGVSEKVKDEPDLHVMYQLRKALHGPSGYDVTFKHGGTARVAGGHAHAALVHYEMLKPADKEKFQRRIEGSYEELKRAVNEIVEADIKGTVITE